MSGKKKVIYHHPATPEDFTWESTVKRLRKENRQLRVALSYAKGAIRSTTILEEIEKLEKGE